jgi:hypothetical protein
MDAIGNMPNWHFLHLYFGPEKMPHFPGDFTMQLRNTVSQTGQPHSQDWHAEGFPPGHLLPGKIAELISAQPQLCLKRREIFINQPIRKFITTRWDWGVGGKNSFPFNPLKSLLKADSLLNKFP